MLKDILAILASTPDKLRREIAGMSAREMRTPPAPGKWSVQIILAHLEDLEENYALRRFKVMLEQDSPALDPFDQEARAVELHYERKDVKRTMASFARKRRATLKLLGKVKSSQVNRKGVHPTIGEISIGELIHEMAFHDLGHLKQILEIKRRALYPHIGNMQKFYKLQ